MSERNTDRYGLSHLGSNPTPLLAFEAASTALLAHRPETGPALDAALAADPGMVAAHALRGFGGVILARSETVATARKALEAGRAARNRRGATADEVALLDALAPALEGGLLAAADLLEARLAAAPGALLLAKLATALRFMRGDLAGTRRLTTRLLPAWHGGAPGYGFLLGCHAFALGETGEIAAAERVGREAVALEPRDAWGLHAVAHAMETENRTAEGVAWIEASRPVWSGCNNFAKHMAWHLALFHLERGEHARVLDLYDREVRPDSDDDVRDLANAISLLWRLEQDGARTGGRWDALAAVARRRRADTTWMFAALHNLLALLAVGDHAAARDLGLALADAADGPEQRAVAAAAALPLARALLAAEPEALRGALRGVAMHRAFAPVGGSHAQRDVFLRAIADAAERAGESEVLARTLAVRRRLRRADRFDALIETRARRPDGLPRAA
jgi:hypothetical protein